MTILLNDTPAILQKLSKVCPISVAQFTNYSVEKLVACDKVKLLQGLVKRLGNAIVIAGNVLVDDNALKHYLADDNTVILEVVSEDTSGGYWGYPETKQWVERSRLYPGIQRVTTAEEVLEKCGKVELKMSLAESIKAAMKDLGVDPDVSDNTEKRENEVTTEKPNEIEERPKPLVDSNKKPVNTARPEDIIKKPTDTVKESPKQVQKKIPVKSKGIEESSSTEESDMVLISLDNGMEILIPETVTIQLKPVNNKKYLSISIPLVSSFQLIAPE